MGIDEMIEQASHDVDVGVGDDRIEKAYCNKAFSQFQNSHSICVNDEEGDKHGSDQNRDRGGDVAEGDDCERRRSPLVRSPVPGWP